MNASIAAAVVAVLLTASWWLGRRRVPLIRDGDMSAVAALNREQIALVQRDAPADHAATDAAPDPSPIAASQLGSNGSVLPWPALELPTPCPPAIACSTRQRLALLVILAELHRRCGPSRLEAMRLARQWGHPCTLPLLRLGLRDADPRVVREAALAIDRFRGRPTIRTSRTRQPASTPRKVARIR